MAGEGGENIKTTLEWNLKDKVTSGLGKMAEGIEKLSHKFDRFKERAQEGMHKIAEGAERASRSISRITEIGLGLAGVTSGIGLERMVETGKESLEQIKKISEMSEMSADSVAGWRDAFEQAGLQSEQVARSLVSLSKKSLSLAEGSKSIVREARQWGIVLDQGPEKSILSISKAVHDHKIDQAAVAKYMRVSGEEAGGMMGFLRDGPEVIKRTVEEQKLLNKHLADDSALEKFERFHEASVKIHEAWRRIAEKVVIQLAPVLERLSQRLSTWLDKIDVSKIVDPLVKGFEFAVDHARTLGRIMLANMAIERMGGVGRVMGGIGGIARLGGRFGGALGGVGKGLLGVGGQMLGEGGLGGIGGIVGKLGAVLPMIGKVVGSVAGIGLVAGAIYMVVKHLDYFKEKLGGVVGAIWSNVNKLASAVTRLFSSDSSVGRFIRFVGEKLLDVTKAVLGAVSKIFEFVATIINMLGSFDLKDILANPGDAWKSAKTQMATDARTEIGKHLSSATEFVQRFKGFNGPVSDEDRKRYRAAAAELSEWSGRARDAGINVDKLENRIKALNARFGGEVKKQEGSVEGRAAIVQDFRGSRFDIEQKFAEGFDPDRVAVAFSNDLGSMGERKMTSTLGPQFVR